jgi:CRP-like cAMP-binding protein
MGEQEKIKEELRITSLFASLPTSLIEHYAPRFHSRHYAADEWIYREGECARFFYLIRRGKVKIIRASVRGNEMIVGFYGHGDFIGCCCILADMKLPCTAQAVEPTEALIVSREDFHAMMRDYPDLAVRMLQETMLRLSRADNKMKELALERVDRRLVAALLELDMQFGTEMPDGARLIRLKVSRLELAEMAGTTLETTSRIMSKLKRAGWVQSSRERIVLVAPEALKQYLIEKESYALDLHGNDRR